MYGRPGAGPGYSRSARGRAPEYSVSSLGALAFRKARKRLARFVTDSLFLDMFFRRCLLCVFWCACIFGPILYLGHPQDHFAHTPQGRPHGGTTSAGDNIVAARVYRPDGEENNRARVLEAFLHAWRGYEAKAFGHDEVRPVTNRTNDSWGGFGVTMVDGLDTLILMGGGDEGMVSRARAHIEALDFDVDYDASFFESTIRYVGGLLGAYELTGDMLYLTKARGLADRLLVSFDTLSGLPQSVVNLRRGKAHNHAWAHGGSSILSEVGSVQVEMAYLSRAVDNSTYHDKAREAIRVVAAAVEERGDGLAPLYYDPETGKATTKAVSVGGLGDSYYEYLLKAWLLGGREDGHLRELYEPSNLYFLGELDEEGNFVPEMDELVCFVPGMLALGARGATYGTHMHVAGELMRTCYELFRRSRTGLAPERVRFHMRSGANLRNQDTAEDDFHAVKKEYILRPETIESLFIMYTATGNIKFYQWAFEIFHAIIETCRTPSGFSGVVDVTVDPSEVQLNDSMQSFFLSETLKYLYLIASKDAPLALQERGLVRTTRDILDLYIFNTEAHLLSITDPPGSP